MSLFFTRRILQGRDGVWSLLGLAASIPLTFGSSIYYSIYGATALPVMMLFEIPATRAGARLRAVARVVLAGAAGSLLTAPLALPYWSKLSSGMMRTLETASEFSATGVEFFSSFARLHGFLPKASEPLFPGLIASGLAAAALFAPSTERRRCLPWLAVAAVGVALSLGPSFGLFSVLYDAFPPYRALRVPSRAGVLFLLGIALLAALGLRRVRARGARIALVGLAAAECFSGPLPLRMEPPRLPPIYLHLDGLEDDGALLELPLPPPERFQDNAIYVFRSTVHRRAIVNGYSGFVPETYRQTYDLLRARPLSEGLTQLSSQGVRYVLAHEGRLGPRLRRELADAEREGTLILVGEEPPDRLYRIRQR